MVPRATRSRARAARLAHARKGICDEPAFAPVDGAVIYERAGDPDQSDSWHHYATRITDPELVNRVKKFLTATKKEMK